jgi:hypothetical protein
MYEMSARRHFSRMSALFERRATKKRIQKAFAQVREGRFRALVLQNGLLPRRGARISISRTTMRSRNVILKVVSSKNTIKV